MSGFSGAVVLFQLALGRNFGVTTSERDNVRRQSKRGGAGGGGRFVYGRLPLPECVKTRGADMTGCCRPAIIAYGLPDASPAGDTRTRHTQVTPESCSYPVWARAPFCSAPSVRVSARAPVVCIAVGVLVSLCVIAGRSKGICCRFDLSVAGVD